MAIEVKLPELGDGIESGDVLDVLVNEGDVIQKDQPVCELETDKATVEVPSPQAGKIVKVHIATGQSIPIGATLLTIDAVESAEAETPDAPEQESDSAPPKDGAAPGGPSAAPASVSPEPAPPVTPDAPAPTAPTPAAPRPPSPISTAPQAPVPPASATGGADVAAPVGRAAAGPAIRRLAREVGIDVNGLTGSGPGGRITRDDVMSAVRRSSAAATSKASTSDAAIQSEAEPAAPPATDDWGPVRMERMTKIRKTIARKMHESWSTAPRVTNFDDADVTELERIRQASKADYSARGIKLTSMPFVIKAAALALRNNATVNASIDEANEQIIYKQYVNVGIAVDTERGLVVPSLRNPDELTIPEIARSLMSIAENARSNNFNLADLRGSTFTISNLGSVGGTYSTPIINGPEVAILLLGRSRQQPVALEGQVAVRLMMPLSLSYDHRLVDGATAARFLNDVIEYLEHPSRLLIAP